MKERPILFKAPMVRAILDGRKSQTRRVVNPQPVMYEPHQDQGLSDCILDSLKCPFGEIGDRLWVREGWAPAFSEDGPMICYSADDGRRYLMDEDEFLEEDGSFDYQNESVKKYSFSIWAGDLESGSTKGYKSAIHMPRWASRIDLEITGIRVERLQGISEADAKAEGAPDPLNVMDIYEGRNVRWFFDLWKSINGPESWDANPWVWVIEFERIKP